MGESLLPSAFLILGSSGFWAAGAQIRKEGNIWCTPSGTRGLGLALTSTLDLSPWLTRGREFSDYQGLGKTARDENPHISLWQ